MRVSDLMVCGLMAVGVLCATGLAVRAEENIRPVKGKPMHIATDATRPLISFLGWDSEGEHPSYKNMLGKPAELRVRLGDQWRSHTNFTTAVEGDGKTNRLYKLTINHEAKILWEVRNDSRLVTLSVSGEGPGLKDVQGLKLAFPLAERLSLLPTQWDETGPLQLPAVVFAQKHGQIRISCAEVPNMRGAYDGTLALELPAPVQNRVYRIELAPFVLAPPANLKDKALWEMARRNWLGPLAPSARSPFGILANNPFSDVASCSIWFYADQAFFAPEPSPGVSVMTRVRDTAMLYSVSVLVNRKGMKPKQNS